jgi:hypothetical protein
MANKNIKSGFIADNTCRLHARLRTAKEASQLLEKLRSDYQSLALEEQRGVKNFMSDLFESQRRFGSTGRRQWH